MSSNTLPTACELCQEALSITNPNSERADLTVRELKASAAQGCPCCQFIATEIGNIEQVPAEVILRSDGLAIEDERRATRPDLQSMVVWKPKCNRVLYKVFDYPKKYENSQTEFEFFCRTQCASSSLEEMIFLRDLHSSPNSESCYSMIMRWLATCASKHSKCQQGPTPLPTSILDLSQNDPILTDGKDINCRYVILSHCWGSTPTLITTAATERGHRDRIPTSTLPLTFRHAVEITKRLGIRYLWIDSLCIIQDSQENWILESAKMKDYYRNAHLTISALESPDSHCGIFRERKRSQCVRLPYDPTLPDLYMRLPLPELDAIFSKSVLNGRAWVLQERMLSRRILHYGMEELYWECNTCAISCLVYK